ncbi:MAG: hypothetical protein K0S18_966 [Anaerocolumna sp.]|jgi:uncharacterized protein YqfB (UPF0267 family)|nr:hypothetical protein [Anaerocolumna sp.]
MKRLIVDRLENNYAVCETKANTVIHIPMTEIPNNTKEGDVLMLMEGKYVIDTIDTNTRKERIRDKINRLFE